ncbi:hypothetical protein E2562_034596 [Oryza meyeriana var. granulata]|uniref:Uncharacterized protein n=1 Tax=Oryza meyeriana var. granulata TaxID=110450 RepID=A0A6G1DRY4_9ORYZ|nr:hypothetical protein E2562_034596 [Oryza meyeriana var. granulata]
MQASSLAQGLDVQKGRAEKGIVPADKQVNKEKGNRRQSLGRASLDHLAPTSSKSWPPCFERLGNQWDGYDERIGNQGRGQRIYAFSSANLMFIDVQELAQMKKMDFSQCTEQYV